MKNVKLIGKVFLLLLVGTTAAVLLLILAYMLPVNVENRENTYAMLEAEGWYPRASVNAHADTEYLWTNVPDILDNSSDSVMLYTAMDTGNDNPLVRAMRSHNEYMQEDYNYYWHGYVSVLRPLLLVFDYSDIRIINGAVQVMLLLLLVCLIMRKRGLRYAVVMGISYVLMGSLAMPMSLHYSWVFYIAYISTYVLLLKSDYFNDRFFFLFIVTGMFTSYMDLLTYPLFTWGIPLIWWLTLDDTRRSATEWIKRVVVSGLGWILGYAFLWAMKWIIASTVLGDNVIQRAFDQVFVRTGGQNDIEYRFLSVWANWQRYEYTIFFLILGGMTIWWLWQTIRNGWHRDEKRFALYLAGCSSVVWYMVLAEHTRDHIFFTYRIFSVCILAIFILMLESVSDEKHNSSKNRDKNRMRLRMCCFCGGAFVLACCLTLLMREDIFAHNGYARFRQLEMEPDGILEVSFVPTFNSIRTFDFGLECGGTEGYYEFTIWDGDDKKEQEVFWIADAEEEYFHSMDVSWHLKKNREYLMTIEAHYADAPVYAWITEPEETPLIEYGEIKLDGVEVGGQLLTAISYWNLPTSKKTLLFGVMTFTNLVLAGCYVFCPPIMWEKRKGELFGSREETA